MAYSDRTTPNHDPYATHLGADPNMRAPRSSGSAFAGLGVAVVLILAVIFGTSMIGGDADNGATAPAAIEQGAPASDGADAPLAPESQAQPTAPVAE